MDNIQLLPAGAMEAAKKYYKKRGEDIPRGLEGALCAAAPIIASIDLHEDYVTKESANAIAGGWQEAYFEVMQSLKEAVSRIDELESDEED